MFSKSNNKSDEVSFLDSPDSAFTQEQIKLLEEVKKEQEEKIALKKLKKKIKSLPKDLFNIKNKDKSTNEKWKKGDDILNFPVGKTRICLFGKPNSGKTTAIKHLILRQWEPFSRICLLHADLRTMEYDDLDVEKLDKVPQISFFDPTEKTCFIMEDIAFGRLLKDELENLDRIFGYCASHMHVLPIITAQRSFRIPKNIRDMINVWIIFKMKDQNAIKMIARQIGLNGDKLCMFINSMDEKRYESLWIDETPGSPASFRFCGYQKIDSHF